MVYGLKQFRPYILGHRTAVRSDHSALMYLKRAKEPVGQQARWMDFIEQFTLDLQHRKGASHNNAGAQSVRGRRRDVPTMSKSLEWCGKFCGRGRQWLCRLSARF